MGESEKTMNVHSAWDMDKLARTLKRYQLKKILGAKKVSDFSILIWRKPENERPRNASYVILKYRDDNGDIVTTETAYENGKFWYFYSDGSVGEVNEKVILGWDYFPYNEDLPRI
ncbi:MAG: hypothetical protein SOR61_07765 [Evtepia sp.]|nr:hypothetical protein [Evtepia sp.]